MVYVDTQHITKTPNICGGRACIAGHRIRVMDIVVLHEMRGLSVADTAQHYPGITVADVHAALAYYYDHHDEIQEDFLNDEQWAKFAETNYPSLIKDALKGKLGG